MVVADCSACLALKRWMLQCGILPKVLFMVNHPGPVRFQLLAMQVCAPDPSMWKRDGKSSVCLRQTLTDLTAEDNFRELLMAEDQQWPGSFKPCLVSHTLTSNIAAIYSMCSSECSGRVGHRCVAGCPTVAGHQRICCAHDQESFYGRSVER